MKQWTLLMQDLWTGRVRVLSPDGKAIPRSEARRTICDMPVVNAQDIVDGYRQNEEAWAELPGRLYPRLPLERLAIQWWDSVADSYVLVVVGKVEGGNGAIFYCRPKRGDMVFAGCGCFVDDGRAWLGTDLSKFPGLDSEEKRARYKKELNCILWMCMAVITFMNTKNAVTLEEAPTPRPWRTETTSTGPRPARHYTLTITQELRKRLGLSPGERVDIVKALHWWPAKPSRR